MYKQNFIQRDTRRLRPNGVHDTVMILSLSTVPMHINDALSSSILHHHMRSGSSRVSGHHLICGRVFDHDWYYIKRSNGI